MQLSAGDVVAEVDLDGGRWSSLRVGGLEVFVTEGERPTRWGSFPMIPWCGRLRDGQLSFDGRVHDFPLTSPPHANHGFCHLQPWAEVGTSTAGSLTIRTELGAPWPFGGHTIQRFDLTDDRMVVTAEVYADDAPMPAMAGWHPWFRRDLGRGGVAELSFDGGRMYEVDDEAIPTGELVVIPPGPWDACFVGLTSDPVIRWPGALSIRLSSTFDHWVIYTQPEHALCVEPESGAPNEPNRAPRIVRPGEPLIGSMTLAWERA